MYIHLYANLIIVKGKSKSIIHDIHRQSFISITTSLANALLEINGLNENNIRRLELFDNYEEIIDYLIEHEIVFKSDLDKSYFPTISTEFINPNIITNIVFEMGLSLIHI